MAGEAGVPLGEDIKDCHIHLMRKFDEQPGLLIRELDTYHVSEAIIFAGPTCCGVPPMPGLLAQLVGNTALSHWAAKYAVDSRWIPAYPHPDNGRVLDAVGAAPDRLRMLLFLNLREAPSHTELDVLGTTACAGIKVHLLFHPASLLAPRLDLLWENISDLGKVVLIDLGLRDWAPAEVGALVTRYPRIRFILAHLPREIFTLAARLPNVYLDMSWPDVTVRRLSSAVRAAGASKILFGSDSSAGGSIPYSLSVVRRACLDRETRMQIMSGNFHGVFSRLPVQPC